jgi:hypothetical protein
MFDVPVLLLKPSTTAVPFSVWELSQARMNFPLGAANSTDQDAAIWRVELPYDTVSADVYLRDIEAKIQVGGAALDKVDRHFDALTATERQAAFSSSDFSSYAQPNRRFRELLLQAQQYEFSAPNTEMSFNVLDHVGGNWSEVIRQFQDFTKRLERALAYYAYVETFVDAQLQALTTATWTSAISTFWAKEITNTRRQQHVRTLRISAASRTAILRTSIVITAGAARLAKRIAFPGGVILALPVIYDLIRQISLEIQRHEEILHQID